MFALKGIRVIDFSTYAFGPGASALLGDMGADVIKLEDPAGGDPYRFFTSVAGVRVFKMQHPWEFDNRNKRSLAVNLKKPEGMAVLHQLLKNSDVFVSNVRTEALRRLRADYENISSLNPRLIYAHASGYGEKGEERNRAGFDVAAFWARSGIMAGLGEPEAPPPQSPVGMGDHSSSLALAYGILAALFHRERTGEGQEVDVSLLGTALWCIGISAVTAAAGEIPSTKMPPRKEVRNPLANTYLCGDGKWLMLICLQSDRYWPSLCRALDLPELEKDERFNSILRRADNGRELVALLDSLFIKRPRDDWAKILDKNELIWAPVQTVVEAVDDPQVKANEFLKEVDHPAHGKIRNVMNPVKMSKTPPDILSAAPELGAHTEEILLELDYSWEEISSLKEKGVIP